MARARQGPARLISLFGSPRCLPDRRYSFAREPMQTRRCTQERPWPRSPLRTRRSVVSRPPRQREEGRASAGESSLRDAATGARTVCKPRPDRSRRSCRRRRVSSIAFAGKKSSGAEDPNDHSVAEACVGPAGTGRRKRSPAPCAIAGSLRSWNYDPAGGAQSLIWYNGAQIVSARNICRAFASTVEACPITRMSAS
jgi:hypothetical protein